MKKTLPFILSLWFAMILSVAAWQEAEAQTSLRDSCKVTKTLQNTIKAGLHGKVDKIYVKVNKRLTSYITRPHLISCYNGVVKFTDYSYTINGTTVYTRDANVEFIIRSEDPPPFDR